MFSNENGKPFPAEAAIIVELLRGTGSPHSYPEDAGGQVHSTEYTWNIHMTGHIPDTQ